MLGISLYVGRSCLSLRFSVIIAVFISSNYRSVRVSGISLYAHRAWLTTKGFVKRFAKGFTKRFAKGFAYLLCSPAGSR